MIRKMMQFETVSDVLVRGLILVLVIAIAAGLFIEAVYLSYFLSSPSTFESKAYLVGALAGLCIGAPVVLTFFFAAKSIYGTNLEVAKIAREDFLTGLLNRRSFFSAVTDQADMRGQVASFAHDGHLIIADADNFKRLNDTFGHLFGDKALVLISGSFRGATLSQGIAARIGGEEFGVFLPGTSLDEARTVAELIRKSVEASELVHETGHVALSVSLGLTPVTKGDTLSEAMKRADDALYAAKQAGKNRVAVFDSALAADGKRAA